MQRVRHWRRVLFAIEGVDGVFLGSDFISVTKGAVEWQHLKPMVLGAIMEHYMSGAPVTDEEDSNDAAAESYDPADESTVATIKELLETRVRSAVAQDGGDITFSGFREGVVYLHMRGACSGCPSSTATLRHGIENLLKHFCPEVSFRPAGLRRTSLHEGPASAGFFVLGLLKCEGRILANSLDNPHLTNFSTRREPTINGNQGCTRITLQRIVDHMKWAPTSANCSPARFVFVKSPDAKRA